MTGQFDRTTREEANELRSSTRHTGCTGEHAMKPLTCMRFGAPVALVLCVIGLAVADDHDFEDFARRDGCDSVIFNDRRGECHNIQRDVNRYCKEERFDCSIGEFKKTLSEYNDVKNRSTYNDDEKRSKDEKLEVLKKKLEAQKTEAARGTPIAQQCVKARNDIFEHFKRTSDMTESAGRTQMAIRQGLIDKLRDAERRRDDAKSKRDSSPSDENLKREYEKAVEEFRKVEQDLGAFNKKNGQDIERNYRRLVERFAKGNEEHRIERENQTGRWNNCKEITSTSY
jgi:hypothetical protein